MPIFAVVIGFVIGGIAFVTNQAVIGIELLPWGVLLLLLFTNSFFEEFYHRGAIQSLLERAIGQRNTVGIAFHYLVNWLPSILAELMG